MKQNKIKQGKKEFGQNNIHLTQDIDLYKTYGILG
jgi:hypothetical protein